MLHRILTSRFLACELGGPATPSISVHLVEGLAMLGLQDSELLLPALQQGDIGNLSASSWMGFVRKRHL